LHYYVKLEDGKVVDKGILREEVIRDIMRIGPRLLPQNGGSQ